MVFLSAWIFIVLTSVISVYHKIKYQVLWLFTPITEAVVVHRSKKIGLTINGKNSWDIQIKNRNHYARAGTYYVLSLGEGYMDGSVDCKDWEELFYRGCRTKLYKMFYDYGIMPYFNLQTKSRALQTAPHYNIGNNLYEAMLDDHMNYTCGYWRNAANLEEAQLAKMDLIAKKLNLKPGMRVLDIGCGFGGFAYYLAKNYCVHVFGCTISVEQAKYAKEKFAHPNVDIQVIDYRDLDPELVFDRVTVVGMMEHVGPANYTNFFKIVSRHLQDDGIFLLHTEGVCDSEFPTSDTFVHKYIFPNGVLPRQRDITKYIDGLFYIEDWHNFGFDYSTTLAAWEDNFKKAWPLLKSNYDDTFYRLWIFYLQLARALFRSRKFNLWQIVMSKNGLEGGYLSQR